MTGGIFTADGTMIGPLPEGPHAPVVGDKYITGGGSEYVVTGRTWHKGHLLIDVEELPR